MHDDRDNEREELVQSGNTQRSGKERRFPRSLEAAYDPRDSATTPEEREYYQEHVYRLRAQEYFARDVWTDRLLRSRQLRGLGALREDNEESRRPWYARILGGK